MRAFLLLYKVTAQKSGMKKTTKSSHVMKQVVHFPVVAFDLERCQQPSNLAGAQDKIVKKRKNDVTNWQRVVNFEICYHTAFFLAFSPVQQWIGEG